MSYGYIYKTTDLRNKKIYIGKRKGLFNPKYFGSGLIIKRVLKKNGKSNFKLELVCYLDTSDHLNEFERFLISKYRDILGRESLYNISDGGGTSTTKGRKRPHKIECLCAFCKAKNGKSSEINYGPRRKRKILCKRGHPRTSGNISKVRNCILCKNQLAKESYDKKKIRLDKTKL